MFRIFTGVLACCLMAATLAHAEELAAVAEETPPRARHPWAVRGEFFRLSSAVLASPATAGSLGLSVQRTLNERWAWEESIGWGVGNHKVDGRDLGVQLAGTLRYAAWLSSERTGALSFALGSSATLAGAYGRLHFIFAEAGYEYRSAHGFALLLALGPNLLGSTPKKVCTGGVDPTCTEFKRGELAPLGHFRAGLGWSF